MNTGGSCANPSAICVKKHTVTILNEPSWELIYNDQSRKIYIWQPINKNFKIHKSPVKLVLCKHSVQSRSNMLLSTRGLLLPTDSDSEPNSTRTIYQYYRILVVIGALPVCSTPSSSGQLSIYNLV